MENDLNSGSSKTAGPKALAGLVALFEFSLSFSLGLILFLLMSGSLSFWQVQRVQQLGAFRETFLLPGLVLLVSLAFFLVAKKKPSLRVSGFVFSLPAIFFSDWTTRRFSFFEGPLIRGELVLISLLMFFTWSKAKKTSFWRWTLFFSLGFFICLFAGQIGGRLLISDDHAVFFYRLAILKENFPNIPAYNTLWAAGRDTLHLFATGCINFFALLSPLIYFLDLEASYSHLVSFFLFLIVPSLFFLSSKVLGHTERQACISAILSLVPSSLWYIWAVKYGTLGFVTSASLLPLVLALVSRALSRELKFGFLSFLILSISTCLMLCWSPSGLALIPAIFVSIYYLPRLLRTPWFLTSVVLVSLITLPWMYLFWQDWQVSSFLEDKETSEIAHTHSPDFSEPHSHKPLSNHRELHKDKTFRHQSGGLDLRDSLRQLREASVRTNPLVWLLALPGLFYLRGRARVLFSVSCLGMLIAGTVLVPFFPQIELDRMLVLMTSCLLIPVSLSLDRVLEIKGITGRLCFSLAFGFLFTSLPQVGNILSNRSLDNFSFAGRNFKGVLSTTISSQPKGRVLFAGPILHELDDGHIAPLSVLSNTPMLARSHMHDNWSQKDIIPASLKRQGLGAVEEFLLIRNVSNIWTHRESWRRFFAKYPESFIPLKQVGPFSYYKFSKSRGYFLEGQGRVTKQSTGVLKLIPETSEVVVSFHYFPWLKHSSCQLTKAEYGEEQFIRLSGCTPGVELSIESPGFIPRFLNAL